MKPRHADALFVFGTLLCLTPFLLFGPLQEAYLAWNKAHGMAMSFLKFAILATYGEVIGLRIRTGHYNQPGFGILPRALVWGVLGLTIQAAFQVFAAGTPALLAYLGHAEAPSLMQAPLSAGKVGVALAISTTMNVVYAPWMMTLHKITDTHIVANGGTLTGLLRPFRFGEVLAGLDWHTLWHFVFKKTIPFFWIPAHTVTFLLPGEFRALFAAMLSVALGVFLSVAARRAPTR